MKEEWRPVVDAVGWYEVSSLGRVRRCRPGKSTRVGHILKPGRRRSGRFHVSLRYEGQDLQREVHRLVAAAFIGPCPEGQEVNHLDGDHTNNRADNLEYCTHLDNMRHAYRLGLVAHLGSGEDQHFSKLTTEQIVVIRNCTAPIRLLARVFGVTPITIKRAQAGITWRHV